MLVDNQRTKLGVNLQHDVAAEREVGTGQYERAGVPHARECPRHTAILLEALRIRCGWLVALRQLPVGEDLQPRIGARADVVRQHVESADRRHEAAVRVRTDHVLVRHARIVGHGTRVTEALRGGEVARAVDPDVKAGGHKVRSDRNAERVRRFAHRGLDFSCRTHIRLQIIVVESAYPRHFERHLSQTDDRSEVIQMRTGAVDRLARSECARSDAESRLGRLPVLDRAIGDVSGCHR